jgi:chromate reductase
MSNYKIALVVGSLRAQSLNRALAGALEQLAPADFSFNYLRINDLPLYNQDDDAAPAESVQRLKHDIRAADGVIFVTPEYNRSIPGVLKNALDHASRPYGQSAWEGKPAGVLGASVGAHGTAMAQQHLRNILAYLAMPTLTQPEAFFHLREGTESTPEGILASKKEPLQRWLDAYVSWVRQHAGKRG